VQTALESSHPPTMLRYHLANVLDLQIRRRQVVQCNVLLARFQWNKQGTFPSGLAVMLAQEDLLWGTWLRLAEYLMLVDLYICPKCGSIRLYANQKTKQALPRR